MGIARFRDAEDPGYFLVGTELARWTSQISAALVPGGLWSKKDSDKTTERTGSGKQAGSSTCKPTDSSEQAGSEELVMRDARGTVVTEEATRAQVTSSGPIAKILEASRVSNLFNGPLPLQIYNNIAGGLVVHGDDIVSSGSGSIHFGN
jgi:hypothetical protein